MKNRSIALAMLPLVLAGPLALRAQAAAPAAGGKVGVINIQAAIAGTTEGKKVITDLQKKYQPRQQELQRLQQEIQAIQDQLTKQGPALSDEEQGRLSREAEEKQTQLKRSSEDAQNDFNHDRDDAINRIGQKMVQVIRQYASQNGFTLVIDGGQIPIYYAAPELDITRRRHPVRCRQSGDGRFGSCCQACCPGIAREAPVVMASGLLDRLRVDGDLGDLREGLAEFELQSFGDVVHAGDGKVRRQRAVKTNDHASAHLMCFHGMAVEDPWRLSCQLGQLLFHCQIIDGGLVSRLHRQQ